MAIDLLIIVTARNEADRIGGTLDALARAFPGAPVWVADDGSSDGTPRIAERAGARVVCRERGAPRRNGGVGKGDAATLAARKALEHLAAESPQRSAGSVVVLCDGDLGESARLLGPLAAVVRRGDGDLAVAALRRRVGGGLGLAVGFARWAIRRRTGLVLNAPISGQRALRVDVLREVLPFAHGFGMEIGITIDATRAGYRLVEVELDLSHRATGRTVAGFAHRGRQLIDFVRVYLARRESHADRLGLR